MIRYGVAIMIITLLLVAAFFFQPANLLASQPVDVVIPPGAKAAQIQAILQQHEVVRSGNGFIIAAREPLVGIVKKIGNGEVKSVITGEVSVTFPEGASIYKMVEILRKSGY